MSWMILALLRTADAAEVVWLDPSPVPEDVARVAVAAGATRAPYDATAFRFGATDPSAADAAAWESLDASLRDVRQYETRLDGELVIMRDLARPIAAITLLRDTTQRDRLFNALVYQGFAVDRFFMDELGSDERAKDLRVLLPDGTAVPQPWFDAMAIDPTRVPTPYEIAEAPQRARYAAMREKVLALLPGLLVVEGSMPRGAQLWIDGRAVALDASAQVRLPPGHHVAHIERDGHVLARASFRLDLAGSASIGVGLSDEAWSGWQAELRDDGRVDVPPPLWPAIQALGGEVVVAWHDHGKAVSASTLTVEGCEPLVLARVEKPKEATEEGGVHLQVGLGVGGGWFESGDFLLQDPAHVPATLASVNAGAVDASADFSVAVGLFRASVIGDLAVPIGPDHVAFTGDGSMRVRPDVSLGLGVKWAQLTVGFLFPYHPTVGARVTVPVWKGLEVLGSARIGLPVSAARSDGSTWKGLPVADLWAGIGWRFDVPTR